MQVRTTSGGSYDIGRERLKNWLNAQFKTDTGIIWQFVDIKVDQIKELHEKEKGEGLDFLLFERTNPQNAIRVHAFLPNKLHKYVAPYYNLPSNLTKGTEEEVKNNGLGYLKDKNIYFLVIRLLTNSFWFWLNKYSDYPINQWTLSQRYKKGRPDRLTLLLTNNNIGKFSSKDIFIHQIKKVIHESNNSKNQRSTIHS